MSIGFVHRVYSSVLRLRSCHFHRISARFLSEESAMDLSMPEEKEYRNFTRGIFTTNLLAGVGHSVAIIQPKLIWGLNKHEDEHLKLLVAEARALVESLPNWTVSEILTVIVKSTSTKYSQLFGSGNMEKLRTQIGLNRKHTCAFVNLGSLSPSQFAYLYETLNIPIYDRYTLVLEIFRTYANTKEARLQVAMAELQYLRARFGRTHNWESDMNASSVNSIGSAVFTDDHKMMMRARESSLKQHLAKIQSNKDGDRSRRQRDNDLPVISVVGYTNAGKTSLIRCLTQDKKLVPENRLFATLAVSVHEGTLPSKLNILFADTIGFISDIPTKLVAAFKSMLDDVRYSKQIIHIRDMSHPDRVAQKNTVLETLRSLDLSEELFDTMIEVWNKVDLVGDIERIGEPLHENVILTSCYTGEGLKDIRMAVDRNLLTQDDMCLARFLVSNGGDALRFLYSSSAVQEAKPTESGDQLIVTAILKRYVVEQFLKKFGNLLYKEKKCSSGRGRLVLLIGIIRRRRSRMRHNGMIQRRKIFFDLSSRWFLLFALITGGVSGFEDPGDEANVIGVRIDSNSSVGGYGPNGLTIVEADKEVIVRLFGHNFDEVETIMVTTSNIDCSYDAGVIKPIMPREALEVVSKNTLSFSFIFPYYDQDYYFCFNWMVKNPGDPGKPGRAEEVVHQGKKSWEHLRTGPRPPEPKPEVRQYYLPMPLQIIVVGILLILSGLFSGLNLGLMSLDKTELELILKVGERREREYAEKIYPVRRKGNYLLCSLLLGNVIVNSGISILFDDLTSGLVALVVSSLGIVIFGEIIPQAFCSRYGLAVGAYTVYLTLFFMVLTAPLSWPISKILDVVLGEEVGAVYSKERLLELIRMSKDREGELQNCQEVQIVTGALELSKKRVRDVMTNTSDVYMLPSETILDPMIVSEIVKSGYTRIPVHDSENRNNVVAMLNVKDLALLDPEDKIPLTTICKFYQHPVRFVMEDTPLNVMLEEFKKGHYHMAIAQRINTEGEGDPTYEVVGLITLEDILEEIIQAEIMDEFDVIRNNRRRPRRTKEQLQSVATAKDVTTFFYNPDADVVDVSPQLSLATYQYLSTTFDAFKSDVISDSVLQRMIKQNVIRTKPPDAYEPPKFLYEKDKDVDYFILILEGKASITVGESELLFEPGPFHHFGYEVLATMMVQAPRFSMSNLESLGKSGTMQSIADGSTSPRFTFTPDFTLKITHELVHLKVDAATYMKAFRATLIERAGSTDSRKQSASLSVLNSPHLSMETGTTVTAIDESKNGNGFLSSRSEVLLDDHIGILQTGFETSRNRKNSSPPNELDYDNERIRQEAISNLKGNEDNPGPERSIKMQLGSSSEGIASDSGSVTRV